MLLLKKPANLEQAVAQRDALADTLHRTGVAIGLLDPAVPCTGPTLLAAMEGYADHLASGETSHPVLIGALRQAYDSVAIDQSTGSRSDPLYRLLEGLLVGGEDDPVQIAIQIESLQEGLGVLRARMQEAVAAAPAPGAV
ncbi:hypothetical protein BHAOGJBA_4428 [Methylobacterium hispanicum]|uniref:Uncharacterized protein n=1 Tax=Methylobacterium hispanicum TaxID=270350 RepID=A0AAV4ZSI7_9HYPH|nr:hypothetical protein [Methylobacterium hispanicum]GJD90884.1 hypothetical protein BHAOGJBA_4428 [Methylobacterium hispanicum]